MCKELLLRTLCAVLGAALHTLCHALRIQRATDDVVTDTREVLDTAAADEHHAMLLQVVAYAGDIAGDFDFFTIVSLPLRTN